ncbi:MAG: quinate 5-dehydrogenase [Armatimonadetes bacterium]|nr:quinate 5-dehydrogenase [Armatimonadota bacterium]
MKTKRVVSVSLGSSGGDFSVSAQYLGQRFDISRIGVNGNLEAYARKLRELDGQVDAIGLGGIDMYIFAGGRRYTLRDARRLAENVSQTPVVDGSGLKNTLERRTMEVLVNERTVDFEHTNTLVVCAVDRFGMAEAVAAAGGAAIYGDLMFNLGLPFPIRSFANVRWLAALILPVVTRLPFSWIYPIGEKQDKAVPKFEWAYRWADTIVGDGHLIKRHMPAEAGSLSGKTIITNTTTPSFRDQLRQRGLRRLITTTPSFQGRSPGTNVMEGVLVAATGRRPEELTVDDYNWMLDELQWKPEITDL